MFDLCKSLDTKEHIHNKKIKFYIFPKTYDVSSKRTSECKGLTPHSTIIIISCDRVYKRDLSDKIAIVKRYITCSFFINFDILCTISWVESTNALAIVSSTGTMSLTHPPFLVSPSSAITRILLAAKFRSGNSRGYNYLRFSLSLVATTCSEELKFYWNRLCLALSVRIGKVDATNSSLIFESRINSWISPQSLKMYELHFPFSETNIDRGRCISIVSPQHFLIFLIFSYCTSRLDGA